MKTMNVFLIVVFVLFWGCRETEFSNPFDVDASVENNPIVVSVDSTYTYSINAKNYTNDRSDALLFQKDSLIITIVINNYQSGSCDLIIKNKAGENIFSEYSNGNKTVVLWKKFSSIPTEVLLLQNNLTARVSVVLTLKK